MLNLLRFREMAEYPDGHTHATKGWSGMRAYQEYGRASGPVFARVGGIILWRGAFDWAALLDSRLLRFSPGKTGADPG